MGFNEEDMCDYNPSARKFKLVHRKTGETFCSFPDKHSYELYYQKRKKDNPRLAAEELEEFELREFLS